MELYSAGKKNPGCRRGRLNAQREGGARGFRAALMIVNCVAGRYSAIVNFLSLYGDPGSLLCYDPYNPVGETGSTSRISLQAYAGFP